MKIPNSLSPSLKTLESIKKVNDTLNFCTAALGVGYYYGQVPSHIFQSVNAGMLAYSTAVTTLTALDLKFGECSWIKEIGQKIQQEMAKAPPKIEEMEVKTILMSSALSTARLGMGIVNLISLATVAPTYPKLTTTYIGLAALVGYSGGKRMYQEFKEIQKSADELHSKNDALSST